MKKSHFKVLLGAIGASVIMVSSPALANFNWTFGSSAQSSTIGTTTIDVAATAYNSSDIRTVLSTTVVEQFSGGLGAGGESSSDGEHAVDNANGLEVMMFSFSHAVDLTSVTMGWHNDSDFSLLRYTGTNPTDGTTPLDGLTFDNLTANSWELVGNYLYGSNGPTIITADVYGSDTDNFTGPLGSTTSSQLSPEQTSSSYWLVAAMNNAFWGDSGYTTNDKFKIKTLTADYTPPPSSQGVPEPSTLALMSISFLAIGFTQRRRRKGFSSAQ